MRAESTNLNKHSRREEVYFSYTILLGNKAAKNPPAMQEMWVQSPGEGNGNPLQYFCLKNPMDRGGWWAIVQRVTKSGTQLSD